MSIVDIERWIPQKWDQVVGNRKLVEHYHKVLNQLLPEALNGPVKGPSTLILGPSRSGKTAATKLFVHCLMCPKLDQTTLNPCGSCMMCNYNTSRDRMRGLETAIADAYFHYVPIDCARTSADEIEKELDNLQELVSPGMKVVYLDEVHNLSRGGVHLERKFQKKIEETNCTFIASSITTKGLEEAFVNRFLFRIKTELPSRDTLAYWLDGRCQEWNIEVDDAATLFLLARRANLIPGLAIQAVAEAQMSSQRRLTGPMVEEFVFDFEE